MAKCLWVLFVCFILFPVAVARAQSDFIDLDSIYSPQTSAKFLQDAKRQKNVRSLGLAYAARGRTEQEYSNNPKNALQHYLTSQKYLLQAGDSLHYYWVGEYIVLMLNTLNSKEFVKQGADMMYKARNYYKRTNQLDREAFALSEVSWVLIQQKKYGEAERYAQLGIEVSRRAGNWGYEFRNVIFLLQVYQYQQRYTQGITLLKQFNPAARQRNDTMALRTGLFYEGLLNQFNNQPQRAVMSFLQAKQLAPPVDSSRNVAAYYNILFNRDVTKHLKESYSQVGNYKQALYWANQYEYWFARLDKYQNYSPQLWKGINELVASSRAIQTVVSREQETQQRIFWQRILLIAFILIAILTTLLALAYAWRLKTLKQLTAQEGEIASQQSDLRKQDADLKQIQWDLETQERERQRIGRDLHDSLGGLLSSIRLGVNNIAPPFPEKYENLVKLVDEACTELRVVALNLNPVSLYKWGLPVAVQDFVIRTKPSFTGELTLQIVGTALPMSDDKTLSAYRIVQELITNAVRHAQASFIWVELCYQTDVLLISVEDNGKGLTIDTPGMGLVNVRQRVDSMRAHLAIQSEVGKGTTVLISLNLA